MEWVLVVILIAALAWAWRYWRVEERNRRMRYEERLRALTDAYARVAERVVNLFDAVSRAREGGGRTASAFEAVERAFEAATRAYGPIPAEMEAVREAAARGNWQVLREKEPGIRHRLEAVAPLLDRLEEQLAAFRAQWEAAPRDVNAAAEAVRDVRERLDRVEARLGFPVPARRMVESLGSYVDRARADLDAGNPVAARHKAEDVRVRLQAVSEEVGRYESAAGAIDQVEADLAALDEGAAARLAALLGAEPGGPVAALRDLVQSGDLERFQTRLGEVVSAIRAARRGGAEGSRRPANGPA